MRTPASELSPPRRPATLRLPHRRIATSPHRRVTAPPAGNIFEGDWKEGKPQLKDTKSKDWANLLPWLNETVTLTLTLALTLTLPSRATLAQRDGAHPFAEELALTLTRIRTRTRTRWGRCPPLRGGTAATSPC